MPPKDRHGKTAQDYRAALIAELDAVPDYRRRRKAQRSLLLFMCLLMLASLFWLNVLWGQRWLSSTPVAQPALEVAGLKTLTSPNYHLKFCRALFCQYHPRLKRRFIATMALNEYKIAV